LKLLYNPVFSEMRSSRYICSMSIPLFSMAKSSL